MRTGAKGLLGLLTVRTGGNARTGVTGNMRTVVTGNARTVAKGYLDY